MVRFVSRQSASHVTHAMLKLLRFFLSSHPRPVYLFERKQLQDVNNLVTKLEEEYTERFGDGDPDSEDAPAQRMYVP